MNKTESRYADQLEALKISGKILDWRYEPFNLKLADKTWYKIDFLVVHRDCMELVEIKGGHIYDDAIVKFKVAAESYPWFKFRMLQWKNKKEGWKVLKVFE